MAEETSNSPQARISLVGLVWLTTAVAILFWLIRHAETFAVPAMLIAVCVMPILILSHFHYSIPVDHSMTAGTWFKRVGILLICLLIIGMVPTFAVGQLVGAPQAANWWSPAPLLTALWWYLVSYSHIPWLYVGWLPAAELFLVLTMPIVIKKSIVSLPSRSLVMLFPFTVTSCVYFCSVDYARVLQSNAYIIGVLSVNLAAVAGLWISWFFLRHRFNATRIALWNLVLVSWVFGMAHPHFTIPHESCTGASRLRTQLVQSLRVPLSR